MVPVLHPLRLLLISALRISLLLLLLLLLALHALSLGLVTAWLIMYHCIGGPLRCRVPCRVPFVENVGCLVADKLSAVGIVAIALLVTLGVPAIDSWVPKVAHSYYCSGAVPLFVALAFALGVVVASAWRLLMVLLGPPTPFETAVHSLQLVGLDFGILPPLCPLSLVLLPQSILPEPSGGPLGCL